MNDFVEQCRREWRRLRVPAPLADEMAAELAADLGEAESEGVPPEEVLGTAALDARLFAESWAAERGLGGRSPRRARPAFLFAGLAAFVALAISGAALALFASPSGSVRAAGPSILAARPAPPPNATTVSAVWVAAPPIPEGASGDNTRTIGVVLLIVGLAGTSVLTLFSLWGRSTAQ